VIRLGDITIAAVSPKGGDEGWSEHWEIKRGRRVIGFSVSLQGAIRIAMSQGALDRDLGRRAVASIETVIGELTERAQNALFDPVRGGNSPEETT
jgi:hypothetical protein